MLFTDSNFNKQVIVALNNPALFSRIEKCILNAKTKLAKQRLIRATIILNRIKAIG